MRTDSGARRVLAFAGNAALCIAAIVATVACTTTTPSTATVANSAPTAPPKTALWVGNSFFYYNNSMHGHVGQLLAAARPNERGYRSTSATISGSGLNWQDLEAHFKPGGVGSYSFVGNNEVVFNTFDKPFDVVRTARIDRETIGQRRQGRRGVFHGAIVGPRRRDRRHQRCRSMPRRSRGETT